LAALSWGFFPGGDRPLGAKAHHWAAAWADGWGMVAFV
jgi:hypothetical protein